jgi:hypothetical protein
MLTEELVQEHGERGRYRLGHAATLRKIKLLLFFDAPSCLRIGRLAFRGILGCTGSAEDL